MGMLLFFLPLLAGVAHGVIVDTQFGPVRGHNVTIHTGVSIDSFLGIPFIKPPLGPLRFQPPEDPDPWTEVFEAARLRSACPQGGGIFGLTHPLWNDTNEDCIHLNVFAPTDKSRAPYAVMVWFHGGGYVASANIQYPGHFLAARDVVMVVPNYRLSHLGFMSTGDSVAWGNWGMLDQVKALEWVQNNIAAFGGDPGRVTLFGQSAGASSSSLHMFSPLSRGLFHQVIAESGSDLSLWAVNWPNQNPENYTRQVAQKLSCPLNDNAAMMECLRGIDPETLRKTGFDCKAGHFCQGFAPVVDHPGGFLPRTPHEYRRDEDFQKVNLMSGICAEDGSLYLIGFVPEALLRGFNRTEFNYFMRERLVAIFAPRLPGQLEEDVYQALNFFYTPWPNIEDKDLNRLALSDAVTDVAFGTLMDLQVRDQSRHNPNVYQYILGYRSTNASELIPEWMGAPHNAELPYVIGYPFLKLDEAVRDDSKIYFDIIDWNEEDIQYAEFVQTLWTNFAKTGNPTPQPVQRPLGQGPISWSAYGQEMNYIDMHREVHMQTEYKSRNHAFWTEYMYYVSKFPYIPVESSDAVGDSAFTLSSDYMEEMIGEFYKQYAGV